MPQQTPVPSAPAPRAGAGGASVQWYLAAVLLVWAGGSVLCTLFYRQALDWKTLATLVALAFAVELPGRTILGRESAGSVRAVVVLAAVPLIGPLGAGLIGLLPPLILTPRRRPLLPRIFNSAESGLLGLAGGLCYIWLGGTSQFGPTSSVNRLVLHVLVPLMLSAVVMLILNALLLAGIIRLASGRSYRLSVISIVSDAWVTYLGAGLVGFMFVVLWQVEELGPVSLILVLAPLVLAHWAIRSTAEERNAQLRTVRTLAAAVETRGAQREGQSDQVAQITEVIGEHLRLTPGDLESLRYAAAVHNIGLIAPASAADQNELTDSTASHLREHPVRGVAMLEGIDFLEDSRRAVRHHHERWDGRGYPGGLAGVDIPLLARVLATADTYVALVNASPSVEADQAVAILRERAGTHLDPRCVEALAAAVADGRVAAAQPGQTRIGIDHDHPDVHDRLVHLLEVR